MLGELEEGDVLVGDEQPFLPNGRILEPIFDSLPYNYFMVYELFKYYVVRYYTWMGGHYYID